MQQRLGVDSGVVGSSCIPVPRLNSGPIPGPIPRSAMMAVAFRTERLPFLRSTILCGRVECLSHLRTPGLARRGVHLCSEVCSTGCTGAPGSIRLCRSYPGPLRSWGVRNRPITCCIVILSATKPVGPSSQLLCACCQVSPSTIASSGVSRHPHELESAEALPENKRPPTYLWMQACLQPDRDS